MTFEEAAQRLRDLADANHGTVTAGQVEADDALAAEQLLVSAAARALSGGTNALSANESDGRTWFPYSALTFSDLYGRGSHRRGWRTLRNR